MNFADVILSAGRCNTAAEADEAVAAMLSPSDRKTMGDVYITVMGYNPITYFSEMEIKEKIDKLIADNFELKNYLQNEDITEEKITATAMRIHESHRERNQYIAIKEAFWSLCPDIPDSLGDIITDIQIPRDEFEYDESDDLDDDEFESDDFDDEEEEGEEDDE